MFMCVYAFMYVYMYVWTWYSNGCVLGSPVRTLQIGSLTSYKSRNDDYVVYRR
jgi:hypothetical protein